MSYTSPSRLISKRLLNCFEREASLLYLATINRTICTCQHLQDRKRFEPPAKRYQNKLNPKPALFAVHGPEFEGLKSNLTAGEGKAWKEFVIQNNNNVSLEKLALQKKLIVDLDEVKQSWKDEFALEEISNLLNFYRIDEHMFQSDSITPNRVMKVEYPNSTEIQRGNIVEPMQALDPPTIEYTASEDELFTLILTNLDGHPLDQSKELLHWAVVNIPGNNIEEGELLFDYLPPMPWKGTGFHRAVYALFQQNAPMDTSALDTVDKSSLFSRTINTHKFLVPEPGEAEPLFQLSAINWCQMEWDESVNDSAQMLSELQSAPEFDWEPYLTPKEERQKLKIENRELNLRNL